MTGRSHAVLVAAVFVAATGCGQRVEHTSLSAPAAVQPPAPAATVAAAPAADSSESPKQRRPQRSAVQAQPEPEAAAAPTTVRRAEPTPDEAPAEDPPARDRRSDDGARPGAEPARVPPTAPRTTDDRQGADQSTVDAVRDPGPDDDPGEALEDTGWVSVKETRDGEPWSLIDGTHIELAFEQRSSGDVIRWRSGCNGAGADLTVTATRLKLGEIAGSSAYCSDEHSEQEVEVREFFSRNPAWVLDGDRLRLETGDAVIEFQRGEYW